MPIRSQMSPIMDQIESERPELFVLEFGKIAESDFVYTLASTNINQSAPNLVKMYVTIRSQMRLIMDLMGLELSELFPLEFAKLLNLTLHHNNYKCRPIKTKHGHSIYDDEFDYGSNLTITSGVICP